MLSITNTSKLLHISKFRLLKLLEANEIVPTPQGNKKLLSEGQIEQLKQLLVPSKEQINLFESSNQVHQQNSEKVDQQSGFLLKQMLADKEKQIEYLQSQLEQERKDRREIEQGIMSVQASMMRFQNMLEAPKERRGLIQRIFSWA